MAHFDIISSQGQHPVIWRGAPKYVGAYLKPGYLEFPAIGAPIPISWHVGDYVVYSRTGKTYRLYRTPQAVEQGLSNNYGASFLYENVQFFDDSKQLEFCPFTDLVPGDNTVHFSTQNVVSFFGKPANVAERIQACLEAQYGAGTWEIRIVTTTDPDLIALLDTEAEFSVTGVNCLQALDKVYELWNNLGWIHSVENGVNVITIGASNIRTNANTTVPFAFDNGLVRVERSIANADQIGTRLFAYGSMKNMDATYYRGLDIKDAESVDIEHLMIPIANWGITDGKPDARKAYIENASAIASLGLIPKTAYFDGTGDLPDIHPTIERMTIGEVYDAGGAGYIPDLSKWSRSQRIDEIVSATNPNDHGTASDMGQKYEEIISSTLASVSVLKTEGQFEQTIWSGSTTKSGRMTVTFGRNPQTFTMMSGWTNPVFSNLHLVIYANGKSVSIPLTPTQYSTTEWMVVLPESVTIENTQAGTVLVSIFGYVFRSEGDTSAQRTFTFATDPSTAIGIGVEYSIEKTFTARIPQIGFDIDDYADLGNGKTVSMKTGMCAGRDFEVKDAAYDSATDSWVLTLYRAIDEDLNIMFPNADYEIEAGDQFVLLDIAMPEMYVAVASARLLSAAQKLLADISVERPFYAPQIDAKVVYNENRTLREGMWMDVTQEGNREYVLIDSITIDENGANIPTYEVALRENKGIEWTENVGKSSSSRSSVSAKGGEAETGSGSVKSVGLMVPTGMEVEGSPITGSGVMKIKMAQGYKIPQESELAQYFELDNTLVRLKSQYDYLGPRKGLIFDGNAQADPDADLEKVALPGGGYALHSRLPIYTDSWWSGRGVSPGGGGGGGGIDPATMWSLLGAPTSERINSTHISFPVTSVVGLQGAVSAAQIAAALGGIGAAASRGVASSIGAGVDGLTPGSLIQSVLGDGTWDSTNTVKEFVNSSIATATATFRGTNTTATTEAQFLAWAIALTHDLNDYVFWATTDSSGNTVYKRYKYDGTNWVFEYDLNNSSFTAAQWSAINSGVTATKVGTYDTIASYFSGGKLGASHLPALYLARTLVSDTAANKTLYGVDGISHAAAADNTDKSRIVWDADNDAWHIYGNIYTDGWWSGRGVSPGGGGGGGGIDPAAMWSLLGAPTSEQINSTHISFPVTSVVGLQGAVSAAQIAAALGLGSLAYKNSLSVSDIPDLSGTYVTLLTVQTVTGTKYFKGRVIFNSDTGGGYNEGIRCNLSNSGNDSWSSVVLGGAYDSTAGTGVGVWTLCTHETNFYFGHNGSSLATYGLSWTSGGALNLKTASLTNNNYTIWHAGNFNPGDYLPLTGGTLQSATGSVLNLNATGGENCWQYFNVSGTHKAAVGYNNGFAFVSNEASYARIGVNDAGVPQYWPATFSSEAKTLYHSGNSNKSDVAWACSSLHSYGSSSVDGLLYFNTNSCIGRGSYVTSGLGAEDIAIHAYDGTNYRRIVFWGSDVTVHSGSFKCTNIISAAVSSTTSLSAIPSASAILLQTGSGGAQSDSVWLWRTAWSSANYGIFYDDVNDEVHFVGGGASQLSVNLTYGDVGIARDLSVARSFGAGANVSASTFLSAGTYISAGTSIYLTQGESSATPGYISAGGGYSKNTGKYGVKMVVCDQSDIQSGLGQDCVGDLAYDFSVVGGKSGSSGYISFVFHNVNSISYSRAGYFNQYGDLNVTRNIDSAGVIHATTGIWTNGYFSGRGLTQTSDEREKGGWRRINFTLEDIVAAPAGSFAWLHAAGRGAGSTAQYWQKFVPELVGSDNAGKLSMEYGPLAFLVAHKTAEELVKTNTKVDTQGEELRRVRNELNEAKRQIKELRARLGIAS